MLTGAVDDDFGINLLFFSCGIANGHASGFFIAVEMNVQQTSAVVAIGPQFCCPVEDHFVELASFDLPRGAAFTIVVLAEKEGFGFSAVVGHELDALLGLPPRRLDSLGQPQALKRPVGFGHERFADVKSGHRFTFNQQGADSPCCDRSRRRRPGWSAADHHHVVLIFHAERTCLKNTFCLNTLTATV